MCYATSISDNSWRKSKPGKRFQFEKENNRYGPQKDANLRGYNQWRSHVARRFGPAMQISTHYHFSFQKLEVDE
jgi:hypothetical protein